VLIFFENAPTSLFDTVKYSLRLDHMSTTHLICNVITVASGVFFAINQYTALQPEVIREVLEKMQGDIYDFPSSRGVM